MKQTIGALLLLLALPALGEDEVLLKRVRALAGSEVRSISIGVYSRYSNGRPRLVVAATTERPWVGEVLLIRFRDAKHSAGKIVDRQQSGGGDVSFLRLVDPKDVAVEWFAKHSEAGAVYRVRGERLVLIADCPATPSNTPDLDGDGIPEIVWCHYEGQMPPCVIMGGGVVHWNGTKYVTDGHAYIDIESRSVGEPQQETVFGIRAEGFEVGPILNHYVLRVHREREVRSVHVRIDDQDVAADKTIMLTNGCHSFALTVTGVKGASAWVFLEERGGKKTQANGRS
jgi:hypothetical protein